MNKQMLVDKKVINSPIRWTGSKRKLLNEMLVAFDKRKSIYIEPFLGSGIVLLNVLESGLYKEYYVNDINRSIIIFYNCLQKNFDLLIDEIEKISCEYNNLTNLDEKKDYFYLIRSRYNEEKMIDLKQSSYFWFLMKTCFNGVYRVNSHNKFNVPFGKKDKIKFDKEYLKRISFLIKNVNFSCLQYQDFMDELQKKINIDNCFVYCDPPYLPVTSSTKNHILYTSDKFQHQDFVEYMSLLNQKSISSIMISMSKSEYGEALYSKNFEERYLNEILRTVNPQKIIKSSEMIYINYSFDI
ncbi:DNA adenine methylase [Longibaculum muris]|uniref:DNA adenine methylase n=1 Tax=Longibaculum muris TaxID=1796628 RepID=UPI0022E194A8|nr:Dam family site-specific DNA-(adenine-N6)-methyltransferase [Longibaculum muris]